MATWADLTPEQQATVGYGERWIRGAISSLVGMMREADVDLKLQYWTDNVQPILTSLTPGTLVPNTSGLGGASDLTPAQLLALKNWVAGIDADVTTNLAIVVKAIGVNA